MVYMYETFQMRSIERGHSSQWLRCCCECNVLEMGKIIGSFGDGGGETFQNVREKETYLAKTWERRILFWIAFLRKK